MAKINRYNGNLQAPASAALGTERTIFGEVTQSDDLTDQFTADLLRGWGIVGPSDQPTLQDFNAMGYTLGQLLAYLHQVGIAEYNGLQEYHIGSFANQNGQLYVSLANNNVGNSPESSPLQWGLPGNTGVVGASSNAVMQISSATSNGTFTATEVVVGDSLTGRRYRLTGVSESIAMATVGAGGMDVGLAPVSGYVALYLIYNPATLAVDLLGKNATSVAATEVYSGANMPAGYTASALVGVIPTDGARQFVVSQLNGRRVSIGPVTVLNASSTQRASPTSHSISGAVPLNAKTCSGVLNVGSTATSSSAINVGADNRAGVQGAALNHIGAGAITGSFSAVPIRASTPQTIVYTATTTGGTMSATIIVGQYEF